MRSRPLVLRIAAWDGCLLLSVKTLSCHHSQYSHTLHPVTQISPGLPPTFSPNLPRGVRVIGRPVTAAPTEGSWATACSLLAHALMVFCSLDTDLRFSAASVKMSLHALRMRTSEGRRGGVRSLFKRKEDQGSSICCTEPTKWIIYQIESQIHF